MRYSIKLISNQTRQCKQALGLSCVAILIAIVVSAIGCGDGQDKEKVTDANPVDPETAQSNELETTTVAVTQGDVATSPAAAVKLPPSETAPGTICQLFVRYLSVGNRSMAEQMLTPAALSTTSRAQLQLEPVGGPLAKYEMEDPRFATNKRKLCQIDCRIKDPSGDQTVETEITWICRLQKDGWRIAGMMVEVTPDQPKDYLSFENVKDVTRIKNSLIDNTTTEIRNASKDDETTRIK